MRDAWIHRLQSCAGLAPTAVVCVGAGWVREEIKTTIFRRGLSITGDAIISLGQLAQTGIVESEGRVLTSGARVELLRSLFRSTMVRDQLPVLSSQRARPHFYERIDRSLQQGRMNFSHFEEAAVLQQRLIEASGVDARRDEFFLLNRFWEAVLTEQKLWDESRLLAEAKVFLPETVKTIFRLDHGPVSPRVESFWSELSHHFQIEVLDAEEFNSNEPLPISLETAHSIEDAIQFLFDQIEKDSAGSSGIVIQDQPTIRRLVMRVAKERGIDWFDTRDPTEWVRAEKMKSVWTEVEMVASQFSIDRLLAWVTQQYGFSAQAAEMRKKIIDSGHQRGIPFMDAGLADACRQVEARWPLRIKFAQFQKCFLECLSVDQPKVFWEAFFEEIASERKLVGVIEKALPLRHWLEFFKEKFQSAKPQSDPKKNRGGLRLFRVDQRASLEILPNQTLYFFGVDAKYFRPKPPSQDWFSFRDQEILASEFGWMSSKQRRDQSKKSLRKWIASTTALGGKSVWWTYHYDEGGKEVESLDLLLEQSGIFPHRETERGAHVRHHSSLTAKREVSAGKISLPQIVPEKSTQLSISFLDDYSDCPFLGYSQHLLNLRDERDVTYDLGADVRGTLIHAIAERLVETSKAGMDAARSVDLFSLFDEVWKTLRKPGWQESYRIRQTLRTEIVQTMEKFLEGEMEYRSRTGAVPIALEVAAKVEWKRGGWIWKGRADRIDQMEEGLVVIDYKSGTAPRSGTKMLEFGNSLQLPVYAMAISEGLQQPVIAAQFIELKSAKVNRNLGILPIEFNGVKVPRAVSRVVASSGALVQEETSEIWRKFGLWVDRRIEAFSQGQFSPIAADPSDCQDCRKRVACGFARRGQIEDTD